MTTTFSKKLFLLVCILLISLTMISCSSSSNKDTDGLIYNQTSYRVWTNFISLKVVALTAGQMLEERDLEKGNTYVFQVTVFDDSNTAIDVIDSLIYIDYNTGNQNINGRNCNWYIRIYEEAGRFRVFSAS